MFIRETTTGTAADGSRYTSHGLVETWRDGTSFRQRTRMNLGRHFRIGRPYLEAAVPAGRGAHGGAGIPLFRPAGPRCRGRGPAHCPGPAAAAGRVAAGGSGAAGLPASGRRLGPRR